MAQGAKDADHEKDEDEEEPQEDYTSRERKESYLDFRQKMDEFKGAQEGMISESESMKKQGNAYYAFGCYSQATLMYSEALELQPHSAVLYCNRSMAYLKQDMADLALDDANRSLEIESSVDNIKGYWRKAQALLDLNRYEEAEAAAGDGLELQGRNPQLNKVRRKAREASVIKRLGVGHWAGKLDNGIEQRLAFSKEGEMQMTVFGHSLTATYELSVEGDPRSMVVRMKQEVVPGSPPAPPMPYIFEFRNDDQELWLCHPVDGSQDLPTKFQGAGLVKHRRVEAPAAQENAISDELVDVQCARYMKEMNKALPLVVRQLPEKPSDQQVQEEVEICARVSELKRKYGLEVHRRAVQLAKSPSSADEEELRQLAQQLRRRFLARKLICEEPQAKIPSQPAAQATLPPDDAELPEPRSTAPAANPASPAGLELTASRGDAKSPGLLSRLVSGICGGCGKSV